MAIIVSGPPLHAMMTDEVCMACSPPTTVSSPEKSRATPGFLPRLACRLRQGTTRNHFRIRPSRRCGTVASSAAQRPQRRRRRSIRRWRVPRRHLLQSIKSLAKAAKIAKNRRTQVVESKHDLVTKRLTCGVSAGSQILSLRSLRPLREPQSNDTIIVPI